MRKTRKAEGGKTRYGRKKEIGRGKIRRYEEDRAEQVK